MPSRKVWVEVALNGPWGRARQPLTPITTGERLGENSSGLPSRWPGRGT